MTEESENKTTKFEPLNASQLEYAHELLEELHPIEDTPICVAFPLLGVFTKCGVPNMPKYRSELEAENHGLGPETEAPLLKKKTTMMVNGKEVVKRKKKEKKNNISKEKFEEEPLAELGYGIVAYIDILWTLIVVFLMFTLMLLPSMRFYNEGTGYKSLNPEMQQYELGTLGNMGYSSVQCAAIPLEVGKLAIQCPYGNIGAMIDYGVNLDDTDSANCKSNASIDKCQPDNASFKKTLKNAVGQTTYLYEFGDWKNLYATPNSKQDCLVEDESRLFVQYTCIQPAENQEMKYNQMCLVVSTAVLIALLFTITIRQLYQGGKMKQIDWDMATITAGDYTVELPIVKEGYLEWKQNNYMKAGGDFENEVSPALSLKTWLAKEIETALDGWIAGNHSPEYSDEQTKAELGNCKIADIVFSFNNKKLILALRARGQKIAANDFDGMREEDVKVQKLFEEFDELTVPTSAFITFEKDDFKQIALDQTSATEILLENMEFKDASEPTDIIWENRHFTQKDYIVRQLIAFSVIVLLLCGSFAVIYRISSYSAKVAAVFPPVDCEGIQSNYVGDLLRQYAIQDYNYISEHTDVQSSGTLQCFCQQQKKENPDTYMTDTYGTTDNVEICYKYSDLAATVYYWTSALSYIIIGINYILRTVCIMLVDWIGFSTETVRLSKTTTITFWVQFFNSAFLLLLINANLSEQPITFGMTGGSMGDFNGTWFRTVGNVIIGAMMFNLYYPILEAGLYFLLRWQGRCRDRGCTCSGKTTKQTAIQGYLNMYSGPIYYMHYKYSSIMTTTFITFIYGFGMPILFPIAGLSFLVLYLVEKLLLFYGYRLPPMYDERLSQDVLNKLQFAPVLYLVFGYWMASNMQLLSNDHLNPISQQTETEVTGHTYWTAFTADGWEGIKWPMMLAFIFLALIYFCGSFMEKCIGHCFPSLMIGDIELNEDIDNYWASLDDGDRKWSLKEEENSRSLLTSALLSDEQYQRLQSIDKTKGKTLQGVHSYDILANPLYLDDFQYVTAAEDDRDLMIIDDDENEDNDTAQSDMVRVALNLAFLTEAEARSFQFTAAGLKGSSGHTNKGYNAVQ